MQIKAVVFDMFETLVTLTSCKPYTSRQMAEDAGIEVEVFQKTWRASEGERTLGMLSVDDAVAGILKENNCYSEVLLNTIMEKRIGQRIEVFHHLHPGIMPMLEDLKSRGIKIGLISNCYSEEAMIIQQSDIGRYFDVMCLSCREGLRKPDQGLYSKCLERLGVNAGKCMYVGDGGSHELEAAMNAGMHAVQAVWYLKDSDMQPVGRMDGFVQVENPGDILSLAEKY